MTKVDTLRNTLIDKLLTITDKDYLTALHKLLQSSSVSKGKIILTEEQAVMLKMSDEDIVSGKVISQTDLDKSDLKWLKQI